MEETKTHLFVDSRMGVFLGKFLSEEVENSSHPSVPNHSLSQNQWLVVQPLIHIELNSTKTLNPSKALGEIPTLTTWCIYFPDLLLMVQKSG